MCQQVSLCALVALLIAVSPALGQNSSTATIPAGTFVLTEAGPTVNGLARLTIGTNGEVTGVSVLRASPTTTAFAIQGSYSTNSDGTGALTLNATSLESVNVASSDPDAKPEPPVVFTEHLTLIGPVRGQFAVMRADPGVYATGEMVPAATTPPKGDYFLTGLAIDPVATSIAYLSFDGAGNVAGRQLTNSFGNMTLMSLSGSSVCQATMVAPVQEVRRLGEPNIIAAEIRAAWTVQGVIHAVDRLLKKRAILVVRRENHAVVANVAPIGCAA